MLNNCRNSWSYGKYDFSKSEKISSYYLGIFDFCYLMAYSLGGGFNGKNIFIKSGFYIKLLERK